MLGLDGLRILFSEDPHEVAVMQAVSKKAIEIRDQFQERMAMQIAYYVGKLFGG